MSSLVMFDPGVPNAPTAVIVPGARYPVSSPLLHWPAVMLMDRGFRVVGIEWDTPTSNIPDPVDHIGAAIAEAASKTPHGRPDVIIAKSFGCFGLHWAMGRRVPGVWLTPVLAVDELRDDAARSDDSNLFVGGTADPLWQPDGIGGGGATVLTVPGADHALTLGSAQSSLRAQAELMAIVEAHIDRVTANGVAPA